MTPQIGLLALVLTCLFAWTKGGAGERFGSAAVAIAWIASVGTVVLAPKATHPFILLFFDAALATALLVVAIRYSSLWLGVAMMVQAFLLAMHGQNLGEETMPGRTFIVLVNAASYVQLLAIVFATLAAWLQRQRAGRMATPAAPPRAGHPA